MLFSNRFQGSSSSICSKNFSRRIFRFLREYPAAEKLIYSIENCRCCGVHISQNIET